jgi:transposase
MSKIEYVTATKEQLDEILRLTQSTLPTKQYEMLAGILNTFSYVMIALQNSRISIMRLKRILFGGGHSEHKRNVAKIAAAAAAAAGNAQAAPPADSNTELALMGASEVEAKTKPPLPGHGRMAAQAYSGSPTVECKHHDLKPGDRCPQCDKGRVYDSPPKTVVKVIGQAPLQATIYKLQQLRCRVCDTIFTAPLPEGVSASSKYDPSSAAMLALLRYGHGLPNYRIESLQASLNVPLPDSTQWDITSKASPAPLAVLNNLIKQAAQAPLLHSDDTRMLVLSLAKERQRIEAEGGEPEAKAINTTGIVAVLQSDTHEPRKVALFFTGHAHAGNNMASVLAHRAKELQPPILMSDALAANVSTDFDAILSNCLAHARRHVVDVAEQFPEAAIYVIEALAKVYAHDAHCRTQVYSPEDRLAYHKQNSEPVMNELHAWIIQQFEEKLVEPNSGLGRALKYFKKRWGQLTLFLRVPGAPLDNNLCEQALKRAVLHRKGSLFYRTLRGAQMGDCFMSLIHTCRLCNVNAFDYLTALIERSPDVIAAAAKWLPWNYQEQMANGP